MSDSRKKLLKGVGPGLLYAAAAVGVSHLVQSTRAGADYGYSLIWVVLVITFLKFPFFRFGPQYAAATGKNLIDGYASLGTWALAVISTITVGTGFIVQAAVTLVTFGLMAELTGLSFSAGAGGSAILLVSAAVLISGQYRILDRVIRYIIVLLSAATLAAVILAFTADFTPDEAETIPFDFGNRTHMFFLVALIGWMPAPFDIAVWHSIWTVKKNKGKSGSDRDRTGRADFNIGYWGSVFLAVCFLVLGARVMYGSGTEMPAGAAEFAGALISMYTDTLGAWSGPLIATAAFTAMLSTTITVMDGFTGVANELSIKAKFPLRGKAGYRFWLVVLTAGSAAMLLFLKGSMRDLVDTATTISFVTAPLLAYMNLRVMRLPEMPLKYRPDKFTGTVARSGLVFLIVFTCYFLYLRFL